jgi:hypothetical protein
MNGKVLILTMVLLIAISPLVAEARGTSEGSPGKAYHPLITAVEGIVKVKGTQFSVWEPVQVGTLLLSGDIVRTEAGASAEIQFLSGKVQLYENSVMIIPSIGVQLRKKDIEEIIVHDGSALFDINPLGVEREFEFRTKNVQGGVKGTLFTVTYRDQATNVNVYEGLVAVSDLEGNESTKVRLKAGKMLNVREKSDFRDIKGFDPSAALVDYEYNVPPGLNEKGIPSDYISIPSNKGVRRRGKGSSTSYDRVSDSVSSTDDVNDQGEDEQTK